MDDEISGDVLEPARTTSSYSIARATFVVSRGQGYRFFGVLYYFYEGGGVDEIE